MKRGVTVTQRKVAGGISWRRVLIDTKQNLTVGG
jgi:hypothetical protein